MEEPGASGPPNSSLCSFLAQGGCGGGGGEGGDGRCLCLTNLWGREGTLGLAKPGPPGRCLAQLCPSLEPGGQLTFQGGISAEADDAAAVAGGVSSPSPQGPRGEQPKRLQGWAGFVFINCILSQRQKASLLLVESRNPRGTLW